MSIAQVINNKSYQSIQLPNEIHFDVDEVFVYQDKKTGQVILSPSPKDWKSFLDTLAQLAPDEYFERDLSEQKRQLFADWQE